MTNTYKKAYTEVLEILSYFSEEEYSKIPEEKIEFYKENMDKEYSYKINPEVELSEQEISKEANAILVSLFRDYFATESQKQTLNNLLNQNQEKLEKEKRELYSVDNIFQKEEQTEDKIILEELVEYKDSFFSKFTRFIKKLLHLN